MSKMKETKEKCFVMMPIGDQGDYPEGHFKKVYEQIIVPAVSDAGYEAYRVDENKICDSIIGKIFEAIQGCPMAICDLSNRNPNVLYELGLRQAYDKPVVLIQDEKTERIFDVSGISTVGYKSTRIYDEVIETRKELTKAILATKNGEKKTLVKVVKAESADYDSVSVSYEDKIQIMFEQVLNRIADLQERTIRSDEVKMREEENERIKHRWRNRSRELRNCWKQELSRESVNIENITRILQDVVELQAEINSCQCLDRRERKILQQEMIFTEQEIKNYIYNQNKEKSLIDAIV